MSTSSRATPATREDEQELANMMLLAAATYSHPQQQTSNVYQAQGAPPRIRRTRVPTPLPMSKHRISPWPGSSPLSPRVRQIIENDQTRRTAVPESQTDGSELLSPGGISLDDIVYLRAGEGHEGVFELALCIEDLN